jgi:hypothetical protein
MTSFLDFLQPLFREGVVVLRQRPHLGGERRQVLALLERTFADYRVEVAGPLLDFHPDTALAASELLAAACWFLVNHADPDTEVANSLTMPTPPATPAQHLSADLLFRYLPQVHRRARALAPDDRLAVSLAALLRRWPLSGVLSDVAEEPVTPLDFGGHHGLLLLYAERLARNEKPSWVPGARGFEYVELVFAELDKERSPLLANVGQASSLPEESN